MRWHRQQRRSGTLALVLVLLGTGCDGGRNEPGSASSGSRGPSPAAGPQRAIPHPDLGRSEAGVREQIGGRRAALERLLAQPDPDATRLGEAFGQLGLLYVTYDFLDAALACFLEAARLAPEEFRWPYLLGYLHLAEGRPAAAIPLLERGLALRPELLPATLRLGRAHLTLGDYEAARESFEQALDRDSGSAAALEGLGRVANARDDVAAAAGYLERALERAPAANSLHYALALAYRKLGDLDRARSHLEASGDVAVPIPDPVIRPLAELGESVQFYLVQGGEALGDRNYEGAAGAYQRALEQDPESFPAHKGLAYSLEKIGDLEGAMAQLENALRLLGEEGNEERAEAHRVLGGLLALRGDDAEALRHFARSLELEPDQSGVRLKLANAAARRGRFEEAVEEYGRLLESAPEHAATFLLARGTALVNLGRAREAIADFEQAVEAAPRDPQLRLRFAAALEHLGESGRAAEQRQVARELAGRGQEQVELLAETARQRLRQGDVEAAAEPFREAVSLAPDRSDLRYELAAVLGHLGRYEEALVEFRQVIGRSPRHAAARRGEITVLILQERYGEARMQLQESLRLFPRDAQLAHVQARLLVTSPDERVRDGRLGLEIARRLHQEHRDLRVRETLAMALAESGRFAEAVGLQRELVAEAEGTGQSGLAKALRAALAAFEAERAWWASSPDEILSATMGGG